MPIEPRTPLPWRSYECPCGDPICSQHTISGQRSVGFEPDDAAYIVAACNAYPELLAAVREAREELRFYATAKNYRYPPTGGLAVSPKPIMCDEGGRARAALTRLDAILAEHQTVARLIRQADSSKGTHL